MMMRSLRQFRHPSSALFLALGCAALTREAVAQDPIPTRLTGRVAAGPEFSAITGLRELSDGRVLIADAKEKQLTLLSSALQQVRTIGRVGQGPGEFGGMLTLSALAGDTTLLQDNVHQRFLPIHPDGSLGETIPVPGQGGTVTGGVRHVSGGPIVVDARRRYCKLITPPPTTTLSGGTAVTAGQGDSAVLGCAPLASDEPKPVARLRRPGSRAVETGQANIRMYRAVMFDKADGWVLAPSGDIAVVRSDPFRVEWLPSTRAPVVGPVVPWTPIPVTQAERGRINDAFAEAIRQQPAFATTGSGGERRNISIPEMTVPTADTKAPFDAEGIVAGPDNELWVRRHMPDGGLPTYDVFDTRGIRVRRVELEKNMRVVGVTSRGVYTARVDQDGLHFLERWNRPG